MLANRIVLLHLAAFHPAGIPNACDSNCASPCSEVSRCLTSAGVSWCQLYIPSIAEKSQRLQGIDLDKIWCSCCHSCWCNCWYSCWSRFWCSYQMWSNVVKCCSFYFAAAWLASPQLPRSCLACTVPHSFSDMWEGTKMRQNLVHKQPRCVFIFWQYG